MVTVDEGAFYGVISAVSLALCAFLILIAMSQIHEYTMRKTLLFTVASLFGMLVIIFILLLIRLF